MSLAAEVCKVKTVSVDKTYVDYTVDQVGIRVRQTKCRPITLVRGRWTEYGVPYSIPVATAELHSRKTGISSLSSCVSRLEQSSAEAATAFELRNVITGGMKFEDAVASALPPL